MKGVIAICLEEMAKEKIGMDRWGDILEEAGLERSKVFLAGQNVSDRLVLRLFGLTGKAMGLSSVETAEAFGDYWVNVFAPKTYGFYYAGVETARQFLLKMDQVHLAVTRNIQDAHPPRFEYEWKDERTLIIEYQSKRELIDLLIGLIKGVGRYYGENLQVRKVGAARVEVVFP
jgi:hypothetical protein